MSGKRNVSVRRGHELANALNVQNVHALPMQATVTIILYALFKRIWPKDVSFEKIFKAPLETQMVRLLKFVFLNLKRYSMVGVVFLIS